jgi:hypothetical protein
MNGTGTGAITLLVERFANPCSRTKLGMVRGTGS